jgi:DNA-binding PadR family transcriptional regulator
MPKRDARRFIPLPTPRFLILASLISPRHGYAIIRYIEDATEGMVTLGVPTLYENLKRLEDDGLIEPADRRTVAGGETRKTYRLTGLGRIVLHENEVAHRRISAAFAGRGALADA